MGKLSCSKKREENRSTIPNPNGPDIYATASCTCICASYDSASLTREKVLENVFMYMWFSGLHWKIC